MQHMTSITRATAALLLLLAVAAPATVVFAQEPPVKFIKVSAGVFVTCAISEESHLYCGGNNADGACGSGLPKAGSVDDGFPPCLAPTLVAGGGEWAQISGGDWHVSGAMKNGTGYSFGYNGGRFGTGKEDPVQANFPEPLEDLWNIVSAGHFHGAGIKQDGTAWAWGNDRTGRLGQGTTSEPKEMQYTPVPVKDPSPGVKWVDIEAKGSHTVGLKEDGTAWCWGGNEDGECGLDPDTTPLVTTPRQIPGNFKSIKAGLRFSCTIDLDDHLDCFGSLRGGGSSSIAESLGFKPVRIAGNSTWKSVSCGMQHFVGILSNDTARCGGLTWHGQCGCASVEGSVAASQPCEPEGNFLWKDISAGEYNSCGIIMEGDLVCAGENPYGNLLNGEVGGEGSKVFAKALPAVRFNALAPIPAPAPAPSPAPAPTALPPQPLAPGVLPITPSSDTGPDSSNDTGPESTEPTAGSSAEALSTVVTLCVTMLAMAAAFVL